MLRTRVIPTLLLKDGGLVKTLKFKKPKYVGDPINAVKIFNDKEVDELVFLDISATPNDRKPNFSLIKKIASEAFMPFAYGGGIQDIDDIKLLFNIGVEKIVLNSIAFKNPKFITEAVSNFGSQSIVISLDIKKNFFNKSVIVTQCGRKKLKFDIEKMVRRFEELGAGELIINSIDRDGTRQGYDINLIKQVTSNTNIPVVALGGAGKLTDFKEAIEKGGASAVSAGSMFVFNGPHRAVLISYPNYDQLEEILGED